MPPPRPTSPPLAAGELPPHKIAWLDPVQLVRTGFYMWLAARLTQVVDRREMLAALALQTLPTEDEDANTGALEPGTFIDALVAENGEGQRTHEHGIWIDFLADIGDSWKATYAVATMVADPALHVLGRGEPLPRSDVVVLGGDLVYPTPIPDQYRRRVRSAFVGALPSTSAPSPTLLAIPGNHDWYDGLAGFVRQFCQGGWLGGWRLLQRRSYFAVKLTRGWWIWGIDIALDTRIDVRQKEYFKRILERSADSPDRERFHPGDRIILCTAKPSWVEEFGYSDSEYDNLAYFVKLVEKNHGHIPIILAGDLHHYSRYESRNRQLIVSGGGGSYLMGTHQLPGRIDEPKPRQTTADRDALAEEGGARYLAAPFPYPSATDSRRLALGALLLAFRPANWLFCLVIGVIYIGLAGTLWRAVPDLASRSLRGLLDLPVDLARRPAAILVLAIALLPCVTFAVVANRRWRRVFTVMWGLGHGAGHLVLATLLAWWLPGVFERIVYVVVSTVVLGSLAGGTLFGAYLVVSDRLFGWHLNEVFAAQSIIDYRNFVRMNIDPDGDLVLYAIGLRRVPRKWRSRLKRGPTDPFYESADAVLTPHLIEGPVQVPRQP